MLQSCQDRVEYAIQHAYLCYLELLAILAEIQAVKCRSRFAIMVLQGRYGNA